MKTVGIRELKTNLGRYLKYVKNGERLVVTDRKKEIAVIVPILRNDREERILDMIRSGKASWSGGKPKGLPDRIALRGKPVSDAVIEDRR